MILALYAEDAEGEPISREKIQLTAQELTRRPHKGRIVVFDVADTAVGYALVIYLWSNEYGGDLAVIDELYVKPSWRGRGIGTAFLSSLATAVDAPVMGLKLEVTPANERARDYFLRQGFEPTANRHLFRKL